MIKVVLFAAFLTFCASVEVDINGYLAFCPCMGRFGNQMEQFLGALAFAKGLNRTLVLPHLIEYRIGETRSIQIPFDKYFQVEPLLDYHRVVLMQEFMDKLAPTVWPAEERVSFCYMERNPITKEGEVENAERSCNAKSGNPFGPFWDEFGVDFVKSEFFGPLNYDVHHGSSIEKWNAKFPASRFPVLAFSGAPGSFPVQKENAELQQYFRFSKAVLAKADVFILNHMPKGAYIGIHLRNGIDWVRACEHVQSSSNLFSSPQCLGYMNEHGNLTMDLCMPSKELIVRQLKRQIKLYKELNHQDEVKAVFVASDKNHMVAEIREALQRMKVDVARLEVSDPVLDLAILVKSNYFIGNCVSSFSAFAKRSRDAIGLKSSFWAFPAETKGKRIKQQPHEEL